MLFVCVPLMVACNSQLAESNKEGESNHGDSATSAENMTESTEAMYASIEADYNSEMKEFREAFESAKPSEKRKVYSEQFPDMNEFSDRFMELAEKHPKSDVAAMSLGWVVSNVRSGDANAKATELLFENHMDSKEIASACFPLARSEDPAAQERLEMLVKKSPHDVVKGAATLCLATRLKSLSEQDDSIEQSDYLAMFKTVVDDYGDIEFNGTKLSKDAAVAIFEIENLSIGSEAPDIQAEDLDGVVFKLSDYRGKVVVLDFWGHW